MFPHYRIVDVADALGLSTATVSKVIHGKTEKISDEVELEHIIFINDVTQILSEKWNIQPEQVYYFLKDDTDLLNDYLLKHYDVLQLLDEAELIGNIEKYCGEQGITIPIMQESNDCEPAEIE